MKSAKSHIITALIVAFVCTACATLVPPTTLHISARVDGSGRFVFTRDSVRYVHVDYQPPAELTFGRQVWTDLTRPLPGWNSANLDLQRASIIKRDGRGVIALEHTAEGFDLYLADAPVGSGVYEVVVAIPPIR